jgi:hypothetical protein
MEALPIYLEAHLVTISGGAKLEELSTLYGSRGYFSRTI